MAEGLDYSYSRPSVSAMAAAGITFVARYLSDSGKGITSAEASALHAAGINVVLVYENGAESALGGNAHGRSDADDAVSRARVLGVPAGTALYFAVDFDPTGQTPTIMDYFAGASQRIAEYKVGIYGSAGIVRAVQGSHATYGWTTYAWSGGGHAPSEDIYQYENDVTEFGAQVDHDRETTGTYGAWKAHAAPPVVDLLAWCGGESALRAAVAKGLGV